MSSSNHSSSNDNPKVLLKRRQSLFLNETKNKNKVNNIIIILKQFRY